MPPPDCLRSTPSRYLAKYDYEWRFISHYDQDGTEDWPSGYRRRPATSALGRPRGASGAERAAGGVEEGGPLAGEAEGRLAEADSGGVRSSIGASTSTRTVLPPGAISRWRGGRTRSFCSADSAAFGMIAELRDAGVE